MKTLARKGHRERKKQKNIGFVGIGLSLPPTILACLGIIGGLAICAPLPVCAQESTYSALKTQIAQLAKQIEAEKVQQDQLLYKNRELADKINTAKQQLEKGGNLLLELRLQNNLKVSRELANQIETLDQKAYALTEQLVALREQLVSVLSVEIDRLSAEATGTIDAKKRFQQLQRVLQLQKEKEAYQAQITEESNELLLALEVTITEEDGPDDILQKAGIVEDQRDIIRDKERKLNRQIQNTRKELSLRWNMLELLRDIGRGEEDELDLNRDLRIAELQDAIANIEASLEMMQAKKEMWQVKEKALARKVERFYQQASKLWRPNPKGDSSEPK